MNTKPYITASEISEYTFCKRGWWLRLNGLLEVNQKMIDGTEKHIQISNNAISVLRKELIIRLILITGIALLLISILLYIFKL